MTKVLRITNSLGFGGIEKVFELHAKYFDKKDYELVFVALNQGGVTADVLVSFGYRVIVLNSRVKIPSFECIRKLKELLEQERPDVVHTCGSEANFHGIIAARLMKIENIVAEEIGLPNHSRPARIVYSFLYRYVSKVIAISDAVESYLVEYEAPAQKVVRIYNPVQISHSSLHPKNLGEKIIFACLCRLAPIKNCQLLIRLIAQLQEALGGREVELWLIGDGTERGRLEELCEKLNVSSRVKFWGFREAPESILKDADIFVLASLKEGFGLACIEAIQVGLPVIVSNSGGMTEFIRDGENGYLFDPSSLEELVQKTNALLSLTDEERQSMIRKAKETVDNLFSPYLYLNELRKLYLTHNEA